MSRIIIRRGIFIVILTALLVSLSSIFSSFAYDAGANPQTMVLFRFLLFVLIYLTLAVAKSRSTRLPQGKRFHAYLAGTCFTIGSGSLLASLFFLPVSLAIVIFYTYPIITLAGEKILAREAPKPFETGCFILAFTGLVLALNIDTRSLNPVGIGFGLMASLGMSACYLVSESKLKDVAPFLLTFHLALSGLVIMAVFIVLTRSYNHGNTDLTNLIFVFLASLSFATAFFCMFKGINLIGAVNTAMILNLEPVFTIALAFMFLGESLSATQLTGASLVLLAIVLVQRYQRH